MEAKMFVRRTDRPFPGAARFLAAATLFAACLTNAVSAAETIYVNNRVGDDRSDGRRLDRIDPSTGPVATIERALELAEHGSVISLVKTDQPYYEPVRLFGRRHSGYDNFPFTIEGNGAIIDGSMAVAPEGWRKVGENLWKLTPRRKGFFRLLHDGKLLPEHVVAAKSADKLPDVPEDHWTVWRGSVYFRSKPRVYVPFEPFRIAYNDVGLSLYRVQNVVVRNVTFQHFRIDGVSAPDLCKYVLLENVNCVENGRAGIAVSGAADIVVRNCALSGNRKEALLITGRGRAKVEESSLTAEPKVEK
jgi:hypothetical protein